MARYTLDPETGETTLIDAGTANPAGIRPGVSGQPPEVKPEKKPGKKPAPAVETKSAVAPAAAATTTAAKEGKI